ncbi:MAG: hypothetical protein PHH58_01005 [Rhodoferax sp.]|nr:hypothetical protein [Rhodoferax sp.]
MHGCLTPEAMQRGWDCLARFGQHLTGFTAIDVQGVATQTLREARNRDEFLHTGSALLGFPIRVISGQEEAHLIYQGAAQAIATNDTNERRLVLDIGGRSTELILGVGTQVLQTASCPIGSVAWSMAYFADNSFTESAFETAELAARQTLATQGATFAADHWQRCYGSAGTVNAVVDVLSACGWPDDVVTVQGLDWLLQQLLSARHLDRLQLPGLRDDRKPIIGGGLSVLRAIFGLLNIGQLTPCSGGLRHGLLLDLIKKA